MSGANGHGRRAILYARVSTEEQARSGYSLAQQIAALRQYASHEGYEVLEEVTDPGQSGATLERPGMDRVRDLVAGTPGGVSVVLAQDRDRFAREPAYHYLLRREFEDHGTRMRALNDRGDDSPEGQLADGVIDQIAKYQRSKIAEQSRRGKLQKASEGKVIATNKISYGFAYNESRSGYVVREEHMRIVRRVFYMVGVEGASLYRVKKTFEQEGIKTPDGSSQYWNKKTLRETILEDLYRPHAVGEMEALVSEGLMSPEVKARLDQDLCYGVWWFNRRRHVRTRAKRPDGSYYWRQKVIPRPREEWIAVPVPDSGVPREHVEAAREAIKDNHREPAANYRYWELAGVFVCGVCGRQMSKTRRNKGRGYEGYYHYYFCPTRINKGRDACTQARGFRAEPVEAGLWNLVRGLLENPEKLRSGLDARIEEARKDRRGDPEREAKACLERIAAAGRKREGYLELAAEGFMGRDELRAKLADLEEDKAAAERNLATIRGHAEHIDALERDRDEILESYAARTLERLQNTTADQRHHLYKALRIKLTAGADRSLSAEGDVLMPAFPFAAKPGRA